MRTKAIPIMAKQKINGRSAFLQLLIDEGVTHLFGNPGTTELPVMEVISKYPRLEYVLGLQESVVLAMADGYSRATGKLTACNLHCAPGLGHAMGALYSAKFSGSPVIVTAGQYEIGHGLTEPLLYDRLVPIAQPLVKWAVEVERIEDLPRIVHRAAKIALAPPTGPVFISLPGSILDDEAEIDLGFPSRIEGAMRPADRVIAGMAARILQASRPVILAGKELADHDAFDEACQFAECIGAAVYLGSVPYNGRFPSDHPLNMGDITRNQERVRAALTGHDLLVCLGGDLLRMSPYSPTEPLPEDLPVLHISERDWELGKNYPTETAICANVKETLRALLPALNAAKTATYASAAAARCAALRLENWSAARARHMAALEAKKDETPIWTEYLMARISEAIPGNAIVVEEAVSSAAGLARVLHSNDPHSYYGLASGGLGFGVPGAIGISLAHPGRPVVGVIGDGSAMYSIQGLWTAAHMKLPITYIIVNNRSYRIIKDRLVAMRRTDAFVGMDMRDPSIDFLALGASMGLRTARVTHPAEIDATILRMMAGAGPSLIDVIVEDGFGNASAFEYCSANP
jgi:benzoylformate decarboxylase